MAAPFRYCKDEKKHVCSAAITDNDPIIVSAVKELSGCLSASENYVTATDYFPLSIHCIANICFSLAKAGNVFYFSPESDIEEARKLISQKDSEGTIREIYLKTGAPLSR